MSVNPPMTAGPLIIDCDTGRDDALSIWLALALRHDLAAVVASYGNTNLDNVCENCARVLALAGHADIPVWRGESGPLAAHSGEAGIIAPKQLAAGNGLCNLELPVSSSAPVPMNADQRAEALRRIAREKGAIDYVILGPATNFAATYKALGDDATAVIRRVTMWGGKLGALWDETPGPDFNFGCDPFAVSLLLEAASRHKIPVRFIPMNFTWPIVMPLPELEALRAHSAVGRIARDLMIAHARHFAPEPVFRFHDPCVIMALSHEAHFRKARVVLESKDRQPDFGRLSEHGQGTPVAIFEGDAALHAKLMAEILALLSLKRA